MAEQGTYLLHTRLGSVSVPLPHSCIECMANDTDGRGNHAPHIIAGINLSFFLGQDNGYFGVVSAHYAQCFGPTDVLGYDITRFFLRILHYGLSIVKIINISVICHLSIYRLSLNIHLPIIIHLPAFTTLFFLRASIRFSKSSATHTGKPKTATKIAKNRTPPQAIP